MELIPLPSKSKSKHTLDVLARPHILRVVEVRDSGVAVLEESVAARIEEQVKILAHNPLPILNANAYLERFQRNAIWLVGAVGAAMKDASCRSAIPATRATIYGA